MKAHLKNFINVTRLNKPIGFLLLFWPCSWGLSLALYFNGDLNIFLYYLFLFFCGSVLMRSAGCIINDIVDEKIDKKVFRTKNRPIASGLLSKKLAWIYTLILCSLAFLILIQFNFLTICLGIFSMTFVFSYPFMKRYTYFPQLFLAIVFNFSILISWTAAKGIFDNQSLLLYLACIFWTLGYDTIYAYQDKEDDKKIGVKSLAIYLEQNIKFWITLFYLCFIGIF